MNFLATKSWILVFLLIGFSCTEDDTMKDTEDEMENEEENSELPASFDVLIQFAGTYKVTSVINGEHSEADIVVGENGNITFDSDITFTAGDIYEIYDRVSCPNCERVQVNYDQNDDGRVILLWLNAGGDTVNRIQYRHNTESISIEVAVEKV